MEVKIGVSARHVHLCVEDFKKLFGNAELTIYRQLTQPGMFAAEEKVNIITEFGRIDGVRIVGPLRDYTQVEVTKTDSYNLKLNPPIRTSGDLEGASDVWLEANGNRILAKNSCIIANRHIHVSYIELEKYNLKNGQKVSVKIDSEKGAILNNVYIKASEQACFEMHIDLDDANANLINNGDIGEILE